MSDGHRAITRRELLKLSAAATTASLLLACVPQQGTPGATAPGGSPAATDAPQKAGRFELGKLEGAEVITDASKFPKSFKEAPELAALVQQGKLPPVAERVGQDPLVLKPAHSVGKYRGTLRRAFMPGGRSGPDEERFATGPDSLVWWDYQFKKIVPNIARGYELSSDLKTLTIQLRRGMRWSDGAPFTADDILFWYEDMYLNKQLVPTPHANLQINGKNVIIQKADQYTVRFVSPDPNPLLVELLATRGPLAGPASELGGANGMGTFAPKHYLSQFHPKYAAGGQAAVDKIVADAKFANWATFFKARNDWTINADLPVVTPWKVVKGKEVRTQNFVLERNPFSIWVDTDGNQLPYIGQVSMSPAENLEVVNLRAAAGEYDFQARSVQVSKLPVLIENEAKGGYKVHLNPGQINDLAVRFNLAYDEDPVIGELLRTTDFRRALSLGIDREQISEAFVLGTATPSAALPADDNRYFPGKEYRTLWATKDIAKANQMLDKIGLDKKDAEAYRLRKDGKRLRIEFTGNASNFADFPAIAEMVKQQWKAIGVDVTVNAVSPTLSTERAQANLIQFTIHQASSEDIFVSPGAAFPSSTAGIQGVAGPPFVRWFATNGKEGKEPPAKMREVMDLWRRGYVAPEAERIKIGQEMHKIIADEVFSAGILGPGLTVYGLYIAKTSLGNVPGRVVNSTAVKNPLNAFPMTFYFK